jgi:hypothetical protein
LCSAHRQQVSNCENVPLDDVDGIMYSAVHG